jgi:hypothetical protein
VKVILAAQAVCAFHCAVDNLRQSFLDQSPACRATARTSDRVDCSGKGVHKALKDFAMCKRRILGERDLADFLEQSFDIFFVMVIADLHCRVPVVSVL